MASRPTEFECRGGIVYAEPMTPVKDKTVRLVCDDSVGAAQKGTLEANTVYQVLAEVADAFFELATTTAPADITLATSELLPEGVPIYIFTEAFDKVSIKCTSTVTGDGKYVRFSKRVGTQGS